MLFAVVPVPVPFVPVVVLDLLATAVANVITSALTAFAPVSVCIYRARSSLARPQTLVAMLEPVVRQEAPQVQPHFPEALAGMRCGCGCLFR